jgi:hypothetical protein
MKEYALSLSFFTPLFSVLLTTVYSCINYTMQNWWIFCRNPGGFFDIFLHTGESFDINTTAKGGRGLPMQMLVYFTKRNSPKLLEWALCTFVQCTVVHTIV